MELMLRQALDDSVEVTSGGTMGMPSWPVSPPMAELLVRDGVKGVDEFRSQWLTEKMVNDADLILTATGEHRSQVLNLSPLAMRRTMSLGELARLAQSVDKSAWANATTDAERLKILVPAALAARHANPRGPEADDIIDPYKRSAETYQLSHNQITHHITNLTNALRA